MTDYDDYLDRLFSSPELETGIDRQLVALREAIKNRRLADSVALVVETAGSKPRVVVRCQDGGCGRELATVYDTNRGPLFSSTIVGRPRDTESAERPPWLVLDRLNKLDDSLIGDDARLFAAMFGQPGRPGIVRNPPTMPWDVTSAPAPHTVHFLIAPLTLVPLWARCKGKHGHPAVVIDGPALFKSYEAATRQKKFKQPFLGGVRPLR